MLKMLRKKGLAKRLIWIIAIVIIFSFGFFGTAYLITGNTGSSYAGKIYGKRVSIEDFNKVYQNARILAVKQYGTNLNKVAHLLNLEAQTWDLILLLHEAKKKKIKISNKDVINTIENDDSFKRNGKFDIVIYNSILRNLQIRPRDYEEIVRDNLKIAELYKHITASITISEDEVLNEYRNRNEKVQISYILVKYDDFLNQVNPEESKIEQYYTDNGSEFQNPPSVNVQYLTFSFPDPESSEIDSPNADDTDAINDLIEEQKDVLRDKADEIFNELLINPDMAEIAKTRNLDVKTSGFFSMEQPNLSLGWSYDLLKRIFEMNVKDVSEPVETSNGLTIVQIKEKRDAYIPKFSEVKDKVRTAVAKTMAKDVAKEQAELQLKNIQSKLDASKGREFANVAKGLGASVSQTPEFARDQYLPQVGISKEFQDAAFSLTEENKLSDVVEIATGFCILHLDRYVPIDEAAYESEKEEIAKSISDEKQKAAFADLVAQLRVKSGLIDNIPELRAAAQ